MICDVNQWDCPARFYSSRSCTLQVLSLAGLPAPFSSIYLNLFFGLIADLQQCLYCKMYSCFYLLCAYLRLQSNNWLFQHNPVRKRYLQMFQQHCTVCYSYFDIGARKFHHRPDRMTANHSFFPHRTADIDDRIQEYPLQPMNSMKSLLQLHQKLNHWKGHNES